MILLVDNYDSFSYNLYQLSGEIRTCVKVIRNDELSIDEIREMRPDRIIISPGPGRPENAGISVDIVRELAGEVPILGVCLGHQAICMAFGGSIRHAKRLMHGKQSVLSVEKDCILFRGCGEKIKAARYHSLSADETTLPKCLKVTARSEDGEIMAVMHDELEVYGVQFHPESIMTPEGKTILRNFIEGER